MSLWKRVKRLFRANANAALQSLENPDKEMALVEDELKAQLKQSRLRMVEALAEQKALENQEAQIQSELDRWEERAKQAVRSGNDELAKEALAEKAKCERAWSEHRDEVQRQRQAIEEMRAAEEMLGQQIASALKRGQGLTHRMRQAEAKRAIGDAMSTRNPDSPFGKVEQIERDVAALEERVVLQQDTQSRVADVVVEQQLLTAQKAHHREQELQDDLAALKRKMKERSASSKE